MSVSYPEGSCGAKWICIQGNAYTESSFERCVWFSASLLNVLDDKCSEIVSTTVIYQIKINSN